eukprot:1988032-Pyramimonas_sp.AAC.1
MMPPKGWTIHGLWPDYDPSKPHSREYPQYCDNRLKFAESKVVDLEPQLNSYWPNCFLDTPHTGASLLHHLPHVHVVLTEW